MVRLKDKLCHSPLLEEERKNHAGHHGNANGELGDTSPHMLTAVVHRHHCGKGHGKKARTSLVGMSQRHGHTGNHSAACLKGSTLSHKLIGWFYS